ncbi:MAG: hypothetical protein GY705_15515 [Bacteroidetes bacterium]|nr:hypothetical protein [Bacteroidota bacterium]
MEEYNVFEQPLPPVFLTNIISHTNKETAHRMTEQAHTKGLIVYLYYNEPWEGFLVHAIKSFTDIVTKTGVADSFYFIRYWERGPHIRLIFRGEPEVIDQILKPNIEEHFNNFFDDRPSFILLPTYPKNFPEKYKWLPNNTLLYENDESTIQKFGEGPLLDFVEKQYCASSILVLKKLAQNPNSWTQAKSFELAFKMHFSLMDCMGMDASDSALLFEHLLNNWSKNNTYSPSLISKNGHARRSANKLEKQLDTLYNLQKKEILLRIEKLSDELEDVTLCLDEDFQEWRHQMNMLSESIQNKELQLAINKLFNSPLNESEQSHCFKICSEFIHWTNNRLGIFNFDEAYLYYALRESMKTLSQSHKIY